MNVKDELQKAKDAIVAAQRLVGNAESVRNGNTGLSMDSIKRNHSIMKCGDAAIDGLIQYFGVMSENGE